MTDDCDNLDDYLAGDLHGDAAERFRTHLGECEACRDAEIQQRWIDGLLTSPERFQLEPSPRALVESISIARASQPFSMKKYIGIALATAAVVLIAAGWVVLNRQEDQFVGLVTAVKPIEDKDVAHQEPDVGATFVVTSNAIAVPVESHHRGVTLVRVYPAYQPPAETQTAALESETATADSNDIWTIDSNGG